MSVESYRAAAVRLRNELDLLGPFRGVCGCCGGPDARHRVADAMTGRLLAGEDVADVAGDYLREEWAAVGAEKALRVAVAVLAADPRRHALTRGKAAGIDREVWADLTEVHRTV